MSSIPQFEFGWFMSSLVGGSYDHLGSRTAGKTFNGTGAGGKWWEVPIQQIAAGATVDLYNAVNDVLPNFVAMFMELISPTDQTGYLDLEAWGDTPVSATDNTESNLALTKNALPSLAYGMPLCFGMNRIMTNPTASLHVAGPIGAAGETAGRVYRIRANNPTSVAVQIARWVRN
jgi:hypothetical protein